MEEVLAVFHPKHGFGVVRLIYTKTYGHWMPATEEENYLQVQSKVERLMKHWKSEEAKISVQRGRLAQSNFLQGYCTWDLIPNEATKKSVFSCDTAEVYILNGSHYCSDPSLRSHNTAIFEAKNANHLLQEELKKFENIDFKNSSLPSSGLEMFQALFRDIAQIPAADYILSNAVSGLGPSVFKAEKVLPKSTELHKVVRNLLSEWKRQKNDNPEAWKSVLHL